jgi:hypothetical protein
MRGMALFKKIPTWDDLTFLPGTLTVQVTPPAGFSPVRQPGMKITDSTATVSAVQDGPLDIGISFEAS